VHLQLGVGLQFICPPAGEGARKCLLKGLKEYGKGRGLRSAAKRRGLIEALPSFRGSTLLRGDPRLGAAT
jgi:hypothetical protein